MPRPIDSAMGQTRPDKDAIRQMWVECVELAQQTHDDESIPLYLTLPGERGQDVQRLIEAGVLRRAESGSIDERDIWKVVAYESNTEAFMEVRRRFPGMRVRRNVADLIRQDSEFAWPPRADVRLCRAPVVNLDLNGPLSVSKKGKTIGFTELRWIAKFAKLHAKDDPVDWTLCLTVNADLAWSADVCKHVHRALRQSFAADPDFAAGCEVILGPELYAALCGQAPIAMADLSPHERQALLTVFVPKEIITTVSPQTWAITVQESLAYGGHDDHAAMVTWIIGFEYDDSVAAHPPASYQAALHTILTAAGRVEADGSVVATLPD